MNVLLVEPVLLSAPWKRFPRETASTISMRMLASSAEPAQTHVRLEQSRLRDHLISKNKYFGAAEDALLKEVCFKLFPNETLMPELQRTLLDIEAKAAAMSKKRNVIINFDEEISKAIYKNEEDAEQVAEERARRFNDYIELPAEDDLVE